MTVTCTTASDAANRYHQVHVGKIRCVTAPCKSRQVLHIVTLKLCRTAHQELQVVADHGGQVLVVIAVAVAVQIGGVAARAAVRQ